MTDARLSSSEKPLCFCAASPSDAEWLVAVTALGMCRAVELKLVSAEYACRRLFNPALMRRLEKLGVRPELFEVAHLASELEDVSEIVPEKLSSALRAIEASLVEAMTPGVVDQRDDEKWLQPLI